MRRDLKLDDAVAAARDDVPEAETVTAAAARGWARLAPQTAEPAPDRHVIRGCADVRALLEAHAQGALPAARALLVADHLRECAPCRAARPGGRRLALLPWRPAAAAAAAPPRPRVMWAVAAAAVLAAGLSTFFAWPVPKAPVARRATVQSVTGALQRVAAGSAAAAQPGQLVADAEPVRTARGSRAVLRLGDGSTVEMGERAELSVTGSGADLTIHLARGHIIVEAARRRRGHLRVASGEATVEVTGTVFTVNRGLKGSRVSVLEGQVRVEAGAGPAVLSPGEQWTTSPALTPVPVRQEIAWSGNLQAHLALLAEVKLLRERFQAVPQPGLRHRSALLARLPAATVVFASAPNYAESLAQAHRLFQERLQESAVLREWWEKADPARQGGPSLDVLIEKVRGVGEYLGDEVALAMVDGGPGQGYLPLVLAEVGRPGLRERLEGAFVGSDGKSWPVQILEDGAPAPAVVNPGLAIRLYSDLLVIAPSVPGLTALDGHPSLESHPFGERIAQAYAGGVGLLFAVDLERISEWALNERRPGSAKRAAVLHSAGFDGLRHLLVERKDVDLRAHTEAVLAFQGPARGVPSWLAAPAAMGSLDFVSASAPLATVFVLKSPALIFDDVAAMLSAAPEESGLLARLESRLDLRLREDLAETLGAELAFALDGPLLPTPSWKLVAEVYDPARLQSTLLSLVARLDDEAQRAGEPGLALEAEQVGDVTFYAVRGGLPTDVHYAFADGYLVAAPSRALVMRALATRDSGRGLAQSPSFRALFPPDRDLNVSGLVYQNFAPLVSSLDAPGLGSDQKRSLSALARSARPSIACAYAEPDSIRVAGVGGAFDLGSADLTLPLLLREVVAGALRRATP